MNYVKPSHTAVFTGSTGCGKTQLVLNLIEKKYKQHYLNIVILCPTLRWNETYRSRPWIWSDNHVFCIEPSDKLCQWIDTLSLLLAGEETLFIIDDCITSEELDKTRSSLLNLAISGRHRKHTLWMLTQRYTKIPLTVRDQIKQLFVFYPKNRDEFDLIHKENDVIESKDEVQRIKRELKKSKHAYLYIRLEHPRAYRINGY